MNTMGLSTLLKLGCMCSREIIKVNGVKYVVKERLGDGGFSQVDLVESVETRRKYALKRILCQCKEDEVMGKTEIGYLRKLKHRNLIELIDYEIVGSADLVINETSQLFLLLPYYKNGTLHDLLLLKSHKREYLNLRDILKLFMDICLGLQFMHNFQPDGIAHRDLKTANICLDDNGNGIIMDFGSCNSAKIQICGVQDAQKLQDLAAERCSMTYRAPELFHVESYCIIDQRTDIWSLGCLLYAMLYFKSPFDLIYEKGDSVNLAVLSGTVQFPNDSPFNDDLHDLILFMLKVNPQERPFINDVIDKTNELRIKLDLIV